MDVRPRKKKRDRVTKSKHRGTKEIDRENRDREDRHRMKTQKSGLKVKKSAKSKFRGAATAAVLLANLQGDAKAKRDKKSPRGHHRHEQLF